MKKLLPRAKIISADGPRESCRNYCMKGDQTKDEWKQLQEKGPNWGLNAKVTEKGNWGEGGSGRRNDIASIKQIALTEGMRAVTLVATNAQQITVAEKMLKYHEKPKTWKPYVKWYWGDSGSGKSHEIMRQAKLINPDDIYQKNEDNKGFDGYDGHDIVIIDDFRDDWWKLTNMLHMLDSSGFKVESKGGMRQFRPHHIFITSIRHPKTYYNNCGEPIHQLLRRIEEIVEWDPPADVVNIIKTINANKIDKYILQDNVIEEDSEDIFAGIN